MTPLMWAAFHSRSKHVRVLIEKGADPSLRDMDGMSAVHWSVQKHDTQALQVSKLCLLTCCILKYWASAAHKFRECSVH